MSSKPHKKFASPDCYLDRAQALSLGVTDHKHAVNTSYAHTVLLSIDADSVYATAASMAVLPLKAPQRSSILCQGREAVIPDRCGTNPGCCCCLLCLHTYQCGKGHAALLA